MTSSSPKTCRPNSRRGRSESSRSTSKTVFYRITSCPTRRRKRSPTSSGRSRMRTSSISQLMRIAKVRPLPGTCSRCSSRRCRSSGWFSTRSPGRPSSWPVKTLVTSTPLSSMRRKPAAFSTGCTATKFLPFSGERSGPGSLRAACSRPPRVSSSSVSVSDSPSLPPAIGISRRCWRHPTMRLSSSRASRGSMAPALPPGATSTTRAS